MTDKEFNLSDKIVSNMEESTWLDDGSPIEWTNNLSIHVEDVKEFIRILKGYIPNLSYRDADIDVKLLDFIDEIAGDKLVK